jgi:hypothetical protein
VEAFSKLADSPQQRTVIVPAEMGALVGTIAGVGELVRTAADTPRPAPRPPRAAPPAEPGPFRPSGGA